MTFPDDHGTPETHQLDAGDPTGLLDTPENRRRRTLRRSALFAVPLLAGIVVTGLVAANAGNVTQKSPEAAPIAPASTGPSTGPGPGSEARPIPGSLPAKPVYRVTTQDKVAFLTIDDGAYKDPEMIKVLRDAGIKPTLFLTDQYAKQNPEFFRKMRDETGGSIENHTLDHPNLKGKPYDVQKREICETSDAYEREFGKRPSILRPPYGNYDETTLQVAAECGIRHVAHWSAEIQRGSMQFAYGDKLRPGDIVLMHFRKEFKADIQSFVDQTKRAGLTPALLTDYLK